MGQLSQIEKEHSRKVVVGVVDGDPLHRNQVSTALTSFYRVTEYSDSDRAMNGLRLVPPCVMVIDELVPPRGGYEFVKKIRRDKTLSTVPIILTGNHNRSEVIAAVESSGADAYLTKPFRRSVLVSTISSLVNKTVEREWEDLLPIHRETLKQTIQIFNTVSDFIGKGEPILYTSVTDACSPLIEAVAKKDFKSILFGVKDHDNYSYVHSLGVATLLSLFGHTIGLGDVDMKILASGGLLHDVGKMSIPHEILNKPGRLESTEMTVMRSHVQGSVDYLKLCGDLPKGVLTIAAQHHETLDGSGYPLGLAGKQLDELARMASIVDIFGALTDRRVYKPAMPPEKALSIMRNEMATKLDMKLLTLFTGMLMESGRDNAEAA